MIRSIEIVDALPPGKITAWPKWDDEGDWLVGVRHSGAHWTQIALCPSKTLAQWLAAHLNAIPRKPRASAREP